MTKKEVNELLMFLAKLVTEADTAGENEIGDRAFELANDIRMFYRMEEEE